MRFIESSRAGFCRPTRLAVRNGPFRGSLHWISRLLLVAGLLNLTQLAVAQSELVLRDLQIHRSKIEQFDKSAVYLSDGTIIHWDHLLRATLFPGSGGEAESAEQESLDAILATHGRALFQIRHRLSVGDFSSLAKVAEPLYGELTGFPANSAAARQEYIISLGAFHSRLHLGKRVDAVRPFLRACRLKAEFDFDSGLPAAVELSPRQVANRMHPLIAPVFFDEKSARQQMDFIQNRLNQPEGLVYSVALAACAGEQDLAKSLLAKLDEKDEDWAKIFSARLELANEPGDAVESIRDHQWREGLATNQAAVVGFTLAVAASKISSDADMATLAFLEIAAANEFGDRHLAAAALYQAASVAEKNGQPQEAKILKGELLDKYPETYHGRMTKASNQP